MAHTSKTQQKIAELQALMDKRGHLAPRRVVMWARAHKRSALHSHFNWDVKKAAMEHWLWQARELIVSVEVTYEDGKRRPIYVSPIATRTLGYRRLVDVMSDEDTKAQYLAQALEELRRVCDKYIDLTELAGVRAEVALIRVGKKAAA
jgi:hypothetical protein